MLLENSLNRDPQTLCFSMFCKKMTTSVSLLFPLLFSHLTGWAQSEEVPQRQIHYVAIELDSISRQMLQEYTVSHLPWTEAEVIAHHMTILHYTGLRANPEDPLVAQKDFVLDWAMKHEGETITMTATEVGYSKRAFALRITDTPAPSRNRIKHITLAICSANGGSAVDSNYITQWNELPEPITLHGKVTFYYK